MTRRERSFAALLGLVIATGFAAALAICGCSPEALGLELATALAFLLWMSRGEER